MERDIVQKPEEVESAKLEESRQKLQKMKGNMLNKGLIKLVDLELDKDDKRFMRTFFRVHDCD